MLNTDIFKFEFVDRMLERQIVDEYLSNSLIDCNYILWIQGQRGTGKSFFLTEYVMTKSNMLYIYVNIDINSSSPGQYLKTFITQLNEQVSLKFLNYIRANYSTITTIGQKALGVALNKIDLNDIGLEELGMSITDYFISKHGQKESAVTTIKKYITEALKKHKRITFILDNFSQCDKTSCEVLTEVIHDVINDTRIKFIVCTTDEDLEKRFDIKEILAVKLPNKPLVISPFQQKQLFIRMLENSFDLDETNVQILSQVFELCKGIPQQFKEILINLYTSNGINTNGKKAKFITNIFQHILVNGEVFFDINSLCEHEKYASIILQVVAFWGMPISSRILLEFLEFMTELHLPIVKDDIHNTIHTLEKLHILTHFIEDKTILLRFKHDSLKLATIEHFKDDSFISFLHFTIYEYLMTHLDRKQEYSYWHNYYQPLCAYHSYAANADGWVEYNYNYGYTFFIAELYNDAEHIFSRLESVIRSLSGEQLLIIGITLFYCGQYCKADNLFTIIDIKKLTNNFSTEQQIYFRIFQARVKSCMLDSVQALKSIAQAEILNVQDKRLYIMLMGTKQSVLFLSPGGFFKAKEIFDQLILEEDIPEMAIVYQSAMDYYEGVRSQELLKHGLMIAEKYSKHITKGKILNNIAFEYLRCGNYDEAFSFFRESISILKKYNLNGLVYPYSNIAVLYMIKGDWEQALNNIVEALFWNKSQYASIVLKTNRMLCYFYLDNILWEDIYNELYIYITKEPNVDDKIYKKICINMILITLKTQKFKQQAIRLIECCSPHLATEWSHGKYRFLKLYQKLTGETVELTVPHNFQYAKYYCDIEFEPWLINFSHD